MSIVVKDRVKTTSTSSGTGALTLSGTPEASFQSFSVIGDNQTYYTIRDGGNDAWEVGIGTVSSSGTNLTRDTILSSSNSNNAITLTSNSHTVFTTYPASKSSFSDLGLNLPYQVSGTTVASGDAVALNSDNTVSKIEQTTSYNSTSYQWESTTDYQRGWSFDPETNTAVLVFNDSNNSNYPTAVAGTIVPATGVVTWGTPSTILSESNGIPYQNTCLMKGNSQTSYPQFISIVRNTSTYANYKAGWFHVNGTTITMGQSGSMTWRDFSNSNPVSGGGYVSVTYDQSQQNMVCLFQYGHYSSMLQLYAGYLIIQSSGFNTSPYGTHQSIGYSTQYNPNFKIVYDENLNKCIAIYTNPQQSNKLYAGRLDVFNNTYGENYEFAISTNTEQIVSASYDPSSAKVLILSAEVNSPYTTAGSLITWSGNTGTQSKLTTGWNGADSKYASQWWGAYNNAYYQASTSKTYYGFVDPQDASNWKVLTIDTSGTNLAYTKYQTALASEYTLNNSNKVPFYVKPEGSNYDFYMFTTNTNCTSFTGISQTTTNAGDYFGLAITGASSGNNTNISLFGSINNSVTGLTPNTNYFVTDTGSLSTSGSTFVGKSISATSIQIVAPPVGEKGEIAGENLVIGDAVGFGSDGKIYKARNFGTGLAVVGDVSDFGTIGVDITNSYNGSGIDYTYDDVNNRIHVVYNTGSVLKHVYATPNGSGYTWSTPQTLISSNIGGVGFQKGLTGSGTPMYMIVKTTTSGAWQWGAYSYNATNNVFTNEISFSDISSGNFNNRTGSGYNLRLLWTDVAKKTLSGVTYHGNWLMLGSYAGFYYENSKVMFMSAYFNSGSSDYDLSFAYEQCASGNSIFLPSGNGFDFKVARNNYTVSGTSYSYCCVALRQNGNTGNYGMRMFKCQDNTMQWNTKGSFVQNNQGNNYSTGLALCIEENTTNANNSRVYVFCTPNQNLAYQPYNPTFDSANGNPQNLSNEVTLLTDTNWGDNRVVITEYTTDNKLLLAYGIPESSSDQRMYYGITTTDYTSSTPIQLSSAFTDYFETCSVETANSVCNHQLKNIGGTQYLIQNATSNSSKGNKKASIVNFGENQNYAFSSFLGIAQATVNTNGAVSVKTQGATDSNQTNLSVGQPVLIDSTTGNISSGTNPSASQKQIGIAPTSTKILIQ